MSRHEGVSCDSCIKGNFRGLRFKCLICYDYDLCAACFEAGATNTRHTADHPMQCILTRSDYDTFYGGESVSSDTPQSYTCPYCGKLGYTEASLYDHVTAEHTETPYEVVCPICASLPGGEPNQVTDDFAAHLTMEHRGGSFGHGGVLREEDPGAGRGVRRIPHPTRGTSGPRTRRPNMHFTSSGSAMAAPGTNGVSGSGTGSTRERDREREAMDPIAELLSQLSGVRRGLSGVSGASGLSSVLGLGALGSLGGALGSLGANLGASAAPGSGIPTSVGRGSGRLLGLVGRENTAAFSEVVSNGASVTAPTSSQQQQQQPPPPQLERHQALRLPRRQTQVISAPSTFASNNVAPGQANGAGVSAAPPNDDAAANSQLLLSRLGNVLKERRESNSQMCQQRSLFIQDLILSTLALGFDLDAEAELWAAPCDAGQSAQAKAKRVDNSSSSTVSRKQVDKQADASDGAAQEAATGASKISSVAASSEASATVPTKTPLVNSSTGSSSASSTNSISSSSSSSSSNNSPVSTRPKQVVHHNEVKGRRNILQPSQQQSSARVPSASSTTSASTESTRPPHQGSVSGAAAARSRSHASGAANGTSSSSNAGNAAATPLLRKPARPQTSHPPPPPSSH